MTLKLYMRLYFLYVDYILTLLLWMCRLRPLGCWLAGRGSLVALSFWGWLWCLLALFIVLGVFREKHSFVTLRIWGFYIYFSDFVKLYWFQFGCWNYDEMYTLMFLKLFWCGVSYILRMNTLVWWDTWHSWILYYYYLFNFPWKCFVGFRVLQATLRNVW